MEALLEKKLTGLLFGIRQGTKKVTEALPHLNRLRAINPFLADDYDKKLVAAAQSRK
jgi:hypothetical protein